MINSQHTAAAAALAMIGLSEPCPQTMSNGAIAANRLTRARIGLVHVMATLLPEEASREDIYHWLDEVLNLIDMAKINAEAAA